MYACCCRLAIVGGGYIAAEQACIYSNFGADVHMFYRGKNILSGIEHHLFGYSIHMKCMLGRACDAMLMQSNIAVRIALLGTALHIRTASVGCFALKHPFPACSLLSLKTYFVCQSRMAA